MLVSRERAEIRGAYILDFTVSPSQKISVKYVPKYSKIEDIMQMFTLLIF